MVSLRRPAGATSRMREIATDLLLVLATTWACHFLRASQFGLYEDDWYRVPLVAELSLANLWSLLKTFLTMESGQGRPLHDVSIYVLSFLGWRLGGLSASWP
jgi:hypothetical protein